MLCLTCRINVAKQSSRFYELLYRRPWVMQLGWSAYGMLPIPFNLLKRSGYFMQVTLRLTFNNFAFCSCCVCLSEQRATFAFYSINSLALGAFAKFRKTVISFFMSVCPHGRTQLPLEGFSWNLMCEDFSKTYRENWGLVKNWKNNWYFIWRPIAEFSLEWGMFQTEAVEKIKHAFYVEHFFFRKSCRLW
jgi:hypothetical protein